MNGWNVWAGYTYLDTRVIESKDVMAGIPIQGKRLPNAPENTATLWSTYDIPAGWPGQPHDSGRALRLLLRIQSMVREDSHRALLFDLDMAIIQVNQALPNHPAVVALTSCYHNLLRGWSES